MSSPARSLALTFTASLACLALSLFACADDDPPLGDPPPNSPGGGGTLTAGGGDGGGGGTLTAGGGGDDEVGEDDPCSDLGSTAVDFSYLWVANTDEGSVSKVNAKTQVEVARYRTGPANVEHSPSRTTVSLDGRYALVGNRLSGSVVLVAAETGDCVDANEDGLITTSQSPDDLLDWGDDECVLWSTNMPQIGEGISAGPRGMTFDPGELDTQTCTYQDAKIWVGWGGASTDLAHIGRLDPATGTFEELIAVEDWGSSLGPVHAPYGAAHDGDHSVWFTGLRGEYLRIDTEDLDVDRWIAPGWAAPYGMAVDAEGRVWTGGCFGPVSVFDPDTEIVTEIVGTDACHRGVAADTKGNVWVAMNEPCGLVQIDRDDEEVVNVLTAEDFDGLCSIPVGVSVDADDFVWMVDQLGWAWRIDPESLDMDYLEIPGNHYTYSDMTGGGLNAVVYPQ
ncbi:hypothetical protein PPSIR1_18782 [Plesiocystis pacifica SIR-1]|uniref:Virginiamycin B lyase n=1 Tax=Plesiocystis pacifica SIR-1 TaxID=391625 RepID=A6GBH2_9BACT|nr:hypothetical protein [Plesiocystis pacifica]EDM76776.1 hypothetical protein PPSIR1_18782 [Plesiocystis pacifica SIR-1]